ncbi:ABC transporter permease [Nocardioides sp. SR21]|uniref:ABC transporter permease n=1 Tax=Nocardioides sp. SR21 TaxID=2919501 RepID=UPI001FA949A5|nr:ABC transporter permease [Nocardioides sp. SR21]
MIDRLRGVQLTAAFPYVLLVVFALCFAVVPPVMGYEVSSINLFNVGQSFATYAPLALGLALLMIAGEFDLSLAALYGLGAMLAVKTGADSPLTGVLVAVAVAAAVGLVNGLLVTIGGLNSVSVTLGSYIAVSGLLLIISDNASVPYLNYEVGLNLDSVLMTVLSRRSLIAIALFVVVGAVLRFTRWGRDLRAIGGDRRASRVAGVRVRRMLIATFVVAAVLAAVPGALLGYSLSSASPAYGGFPSLVFAITAVLIGGVALSGGQGTALGAAAGVLSLALLRETLAVVAAPSYASDLISGALLTAIAILAAPHLLRGARARRWVNTRPQVSEAAA